MEFDWFTHQRMTDSLTLLISTGISLLKGLLLAWKYEHMNSRIGVEIIRHVRKTTAISKLLKTPLMKFFLANYCRTFKEKIIVAK